MSSQPPDHLGWRLNSQPNKRIPINVTSFTQQHINLTTAQSLQSLTPSMPHRPHLPLSPSPHPPQQAPQPPPHPAHPAHPHLHPPSPKQPHSQSQPQPPPAAQPQPQPDQQRQRQHTPSSASQPLPLPSPPQQPAQQHGSSSQQSHQQQQPPPPHQHDDQQPPAQSSDRAHLAHHPLPLQHLAPQQPPHDSAPSLSQPLHLSHPHAAPQSAPHLLPTTSSSPDASSQQQQQQALRPTSAHPGRKKQFRFSTRNDVDLLRNVLKLNPYGAPHGGRLLKWHAVADTLRGAGIDIDFRRARDRTGLLLEHWRAQDISKKPRPGGNQQEQALKDQLLEQLSAMELAAKPRDNNMQDWRTREQSVAASRARAGDLGAGAASSPPPLHSVGHPDVTGTEPMHVSMAAPPGDAGVGAFAPFVAPGGAGPSNLPALVGQELGPGREAELGLPFAGAQPHVAQQHPGKLLKNNQGKRTSPRFSQPHMYGAPSTPPAPGPVPLAEQVAQHRSPARTGVDLAYRADLGLFPRSGSAAGPFRMGGVGLATGGSLNVGHTSGSPRIGEGQTVGMEGGSGPVGGGPGGGASGGGGSGGGGSAGGGGGTEGHSEHAVVAQLQERMCRLEDRLNVEIENRRKWQEMEDQRWRNAQQQEAQRFQLEKERLAKEFAERKEERETRERREEEDRAERRRLLNILIQNRLDPNLRDPDAE